MNRRQAIFFAAVLALIAAAAAALVHFKAVQRLGLPGVKTAPLPGGNNLQVLLPETVDTWKSEPMPEAQLVVDALPKDTSFGQRLYHSPDGQAMLMNVVLMGSDRTSIHQPQFCLVGQGWQIDQAASGIVHVPLNGSRTAGLPVMKLVASRQQVVDGQSRTVRGLFVYWFVAQNRVTAEHWQRMWWMAGELLHRGILERWAYVTCFTVCEPGREDAAFDRMKTFIGAAVPQFQTAPADGGR
jgi:hypothetical protein